MITQASFVEDYPEFANQGNYPVSVVNYYIALAGLLLNPFRWGQGSTAATSPPTTLYDMATELFVAHHITLEYAAQRAAAAGAPPGQSNGPVASKSVGPISVSYDTAAAANENAGHWNDTTYGRRFFQLSDMAGAGPLQLGIGCSPPWATFGRPFSTEAWIGPPVFPGWFWNT